jgi:hypothetical protein
VEVYYQGHRDPARLALPPSDDAVVVLDLDRLGVLAVDVELGAADLDDLQVVSVSLEHPPSRQVAVVLLDAARTAAQWRIAIGDAPRTYRWRASWVAQDGTRSDGPWTDGDDSRLVLNAPVPARVRSVRLVAAGAFDGIEQIVTELRAPGVAGIAEFAFAAAGQTADWPAPGDPAAPLSYEYRHTVLTRDGIRRAGAWRTSDRPVLVVKDQSTFEVRVIPRLLPLGDEVPLALLALEALDAPEDTPARATLVLRDRAAEPTWSFAVAAPERHRYRHQVTLVGRDGVRRSSPWDEAEGGLLVVRPP